MKQVKINRMRLSYFKGIKAKTIDFGQGTTVISGPNACGKSTIVDAFFWALWGKNANGESDTKFPIKTNDEHGVEIPHVEHEVELTLFVDGATQVFRRTLVPEYDKQDNLKGNHTDYMWNDVPMKKKEYDAKVAEVIDENVFKLITSPYAFMTLGWLQQREMLMKMAGNVTDEEVVNGDPELANVIEWLTGKTIEELKKELDNKIKRVNEQMRDIPARVDEVQRSMPEAPDMEALTAEKAQVTEEMETLDKMQKNESEAMKAVEKRRSELVRQQTELKWKQTQVLNEAQREERNDIHRQNATYNEAEAKTKVLQQRERDDRMACEAKDKSIRATYDIIKGRIDEIEQNLAGLREEWGRVNGEKFSADEVLRCPLYGHGCTDAQACAKYDEGEQEAYEKFCIDKKAKLEKITKQGQSMAKVLKEQQAGLKDLEQQAEDNKAAYEAAQQKTAAEMAEARQAMNDHPKRPLISTIKGEDLPEWVKLQNEIDELQKAIDGMEMSFGKEDTSQDAMVKKYALRQRLDEITRKMMAKDTIKAAEDRIVELEAQLHALGAEKASLEYRRQLVNDFELRKCGIVTDRVNEMFHLVKWRMFQRQVNGEEVPACVALVNGVPWYYANQAARINAGIDVATVVGGSYGVSAPMFLDQAESVGKFYDPGTSQQIRLRHDPAMTEMQIVTT